MKPCNIPTHKYTHTQITNAIPTTNSAKNPSSSRNMGQTKPFSSVCLVIHSIFLPSRQSGKCWQSGDLTSKELELELEVLLSATMATVNKQHMANSTHPARRKHREFIYPTPAYLDLSRPTYPSALQRSPVQQNSTTQHSTTQHNTAQHSATQCNRDEK